MDLCKSLKAAFDVWVTSVSISLSFLCIGRRGPPVFRNQASSVITEACENGGSRAVVPSCWFYPTDWPCPLLWADLTWRANNNSVNPQDLERRWDLEISLSFQTFAMRLCGNNQQDKLLVLFSTLRVTLGTVWAILFCFVPSKMRTGTLPVANVSRKGWERHRELVTRRKSLIVNHKSFAHNAPFFLLPLKKESSFYPWSEACGSTIPDLGWDYLSRCGKNTWWQDGCINHGALKSKTCILILKKLEFSSIGNILIKGLLSLEVLRIIIQSGDVLLITTSSQNFKNQIYFINHV